MRIINADGSEAEMCGNGVRCLAAFIGRTKRPLKKIVSIETLSGNILTEVKGDIVTARLSDPKDYRPDISVEIQGLKRYVHFIDTGVPHTIVFVDGLKNIDVENLGRILRHHKTFVPRGTNVDFVEQANLDAIEVRTYERGVEDETQACGTGSVASALIAYLKTHPTIKNTQKASVQVKTSGGEILQVTFDIKKGRPTNVWLKGRVKFIAQGKYFLNHRSSH